MTVYVDNAFIPYYRMKMCHMTADTKEELHEMADKIGMKREWFQDWPIKWHYDIGKGKRTLAVKHGAIEVSQKEFAKIIRARK